MLNYISAREHKVTPTAPTEGTLPDQTRDLLIDLVMTRFIEGVDWDGVTEIYLKGLVIPEDLEIIQGVVKHRVKALIG